MTAVYLGSRSLGGTIPGLEEALNITGQGLDYLRDQVQGVANGLQGIADDLTGLINSSVGAINDLADAALAPVLNALNQANALLQQLQNILDPSAYLNAIIQSVRDALDLLVGLTPLDYINQQIDGAQAAISDLGQQVLALKEPLGLLTDVANRLNGIVGDVLGMTQILTNALLDTIDALNTYLEQFSALQNAGVHAIEYTGELQNMGSDIDGVAPLSGLPSNALVKGPLLFVSVNNAATLQALNAAFGL